VARRRKPEPPPADPNRPPDWLWQFRFADWAHVEFPPMPPEDAPLMGFGVHHADGVSFWDYCRAREYWREQCAAWLQANDRYLWPHWPHNRDEWKKAGEAEPWKVLRHDRDRPRRQGEGL
jgi:hypothetical protein